MLISKRGVVALVTAAAFAGSAMSATSAFAMGVVFKSSVEPSVPTDPILHGAEAGGAPWVLTRGEIKLSSDGEVKVIVKGLIIPALGTPGPVTSIDASLYCANETTPAATTPTAPLTAKGNGTIEAMVSLPMGCQTPSVLINPLGLTNIYIATSGFGS